MNIFRLFLKKKNNENMLHNAPNCTIQKSLCVKHAPEPPSKRLTIVVHALRHTTCSAPQKVAPPPLANPAYAHGLLPRNLFKEMRS